MFFRYKFFGRKIRGDGGREGGKGRCVYSDLIFRGEFRRFFLFFGVRD